MSKPIRFLICAAVLGLTSFHFCAESQAIDIFAPRISAMFAIDSNEAIDSESGSFSLDVVRTLCDEEEEIYEDFIDTYISLKVENPTQKLLTVKRTKIRVPKLGKRGKALRLRRSAPIGTLQILPEESGQVLVPFLKVSGDTKYFAGTSVIAEDSITPRNVRAFVIVRSADGRRRKLKAVSAFSFGDVNHCSG